MLADRRQNDFIAQLEGVGAKQTNSQGILEFCASSLSEANRETQYFEILIKLFDVYLKADNVAKACESLERLVDIDPYDHRNQQRLERLHGRVDDAFLKRVGAKLSKSGVAAPPRSVQTRSPSTEGMSTAAAGGGEARSLQGLEDLIVQTEIFLQYSLQSKALERLQKIAATFPGEEECKTRFRNLYQTAKGGPGGGGPKPKPEGIPWVRARPVPGALSSAIT